MPEDGQREPGSGGTAHRGPPGAGQARQDAGGQSPPGDGQDHVGTPRPDALIPALDEDRVAALREIGREWDRVSADRHVWRQALPADPSLGEYPEASEVHPGPFTRFVPVAGRDGQLPPWQRYVPFLPFRHVCGCFPECCDVIIFVRADRPEVVEDGCKGLARHAGG